MDDEFVFSEKQSIRESARSLKKYGSTCCNHSMRSNEALIRHDIEKTDTLQGIALKYGCTTEQIRRANRLFASDSLFLRQFLLIPVDKTSSYFPTVNNNSEESNSLDSNNATDYNGGSGGGGGGGGGGDPLNCTSSSLSSESASSSSTSTENCSQPATALPARPYSIAGETLGQAVADQQQQHSTNGNSKQSKSLDSIAAVTPEEENRRCINEFLNKIDNTISESRKYVEKSREMLSVSQSDDALFAAATAISAQYHHSNQLNNSYRKQPTATTSATTATHHIRHSSTGSSNSDTMQLLNTTQMRRVQNSLKRLEKQQDEFFEL
uniref:LysM domain-containing protein n=1 Tax=Glossina brevipalpis TaxID=37001 RepID=A0A1A9WNH5_9MUSC